MSVTGALSRNDATGSAALAASTLCKAFQITAAERPTQVALRTPSDEVTITWSGYATRVEQIKRFAILAADWQADSDELTATMKLKRKPIADKYADTIARLYDPELVTQTTTEGTA